MHPDIRQLQDALLGSQFACVPPGSRDTTTDFYPAVEAAYPDLCDDNLRCDDTCTNGNDQPEWKHAIRRAQQQLVRREESRIRGREGGAWVVEPPGLYLIPVADEWLEQFDRTVASPVPSDENTPPSIEPFLPVRVWGTTETNSPTKQSYIRRLRPTDRILFYQDGEFFAAGRVGRIFDDPALGEWLWNRRASRHVFTVTHFQDWALSIDTVWSDLEYGTRQVVNGFMRVSDDRVETLRERFGSLDAALFHRDEEQDRVHPDETAETPTRVSTEYDRILRDAQLVRELKDLYDDQCQVCGVRLEQGVREGYSEVHHLKPLGRPHNGPDVRENMLVLCPNHHADFDNGMVHIDASTRTLRHRYDESVDGRSITSRSEHTLGAEFIDYHNAELSVLPE